ncbi:MAG: beta-N-acetylhexosaminidase [Bryobacterales bacterium]|nr:beta-N-acetylhexosaminidase [Bryobacterales bacterium]
MRLPFIFCLLSAAAFCQTPTPLWLRGYSVIPTPQRVTLGAGDIAIDTDWRLDAASLPASHIAVRTLRQDLRAFHGWELKPAASRVIRLSVRPDAVPVDGNREVAPQAYRLSIAPHAIEITGNGEAGLFYGVQTLLQLVRRDAARGGVLMLPTGTIEDWPRLALRFLHWDSKHHQDRLETLKRYLDWSARMKVNMIGFELEDKFAYPSVPGVGAPGAFTAAELQEIVNYGLERHIEVVPVIQAPAHLAYVLKHPQYAHLKADGNNYQVDLCNEESYQLIFRLYDDVIAATRGVNYLFASTDEVYYAALGARCSQPDNDANRSLRWVEFARRAHAHLASRGRKMLAWIEYPVLEKHIPQLPAGIIDGVMGEDEYAPHEKRMGMRQLLYTSIQGAEYLFPDHLPDAGDAPLGEFERGQPQGRLRGIFHTFAGGARVWQVNPVGAFGAAWDDSGLHGETFWLGWSAVAQYAWSPGAAPLEQHTAEFMRLYYGGVPSGSLLESYRLLQAQSRAWQRMWDRVTSRVRKPGYGNSYGKGRGTARYDLSLTPPPLPRAADLAAAPSFANQYARFLAEARQRIPENDRLRFARAEQIGTVDRNRHALEVFLALASISGQHFRLIEGLAAAERAFSAAAAAARAQKHADAVGQLVETHTRISRLNAATAAGFTQLTAVFEKTRFPKGQSVNGQAFVHMLDDTKDHWADRTPDLGYMAAPWQSIGLKKWLSELASVIQTYAKAHRVPVKGLGEARLEE